MSEPLSLEDLAWLRQGAADDGNHYDRVLLHLLERVAALEAAQQHQGKLDRLIALGRALPILAICARNTVSTVTTANQSRFCTT